MTNKNDDATDAVANENLTNSSVNTAVSDIRKLSLQNKFTDDEELDLINLALANDRNLLSLVNYYNDDLEKFVDLVRNSMLNEGASSMSTNGGMNLITPKAITNHKFVASYRLFPKFLQYTNKSSSAIASQRFHLPSFRPNSQSQ